MMAPSNNELLKSTTSYMALDPMGLIYESLSYSGYIPVALSAFFLTSTTITRIA